MQTPDRKRRRAAKKPDFLAIFALSAAIFGILTTKNPRRPDQTGVS
jgi:hypothetical protein